MEGDDFTEGSFGGVGRWGERRHRLVEFGGESCLRVVLRQGSRKRAKVFYEPRSACGGKGTVDNGFIEGKVGKCCLIINGTGIHGFDELHNRDGKRGVASKNCRLNWGSAAIEREKRRMDIQNSFGFEKVEDVRFNHDTKAGKDAVGIGMFMLEGFDGLEFGFCSGAKNYVKSRF